MPAAASEDPHRSRPEAPGQAPPRLGYEVVMATRNRTDAVALSLPLLVAQTRPPAQIVVVDSSDDPAPIAAIVADVAGTAPMPVVLVRAAAGLTHQRNVGLDRCAAEVVMFPDDDSLYHPDTAAEIMAVYDADTGAAVAGVAGRPVDAPPPGVLEDLGAYEAETRGALGSALRRARQAVKEALGFANPFVATGRRLSRQHVRPDWLSRQAATVVPYMTGFRMTYRRAAIAATGFDETLRKYGWFEDIDASFSVLRQGLVVTAERARIYHHRVAAARDGGYRMGVWAMLNRGYVVMKHVQANPAAFPRRGAAILRLRAYCMARAAAYRIVARDAFGRDRARGARDGLRDLPALIDSPPGALPETYRRLAEAPALG